MPVTPWRSPVRTVRKPNYPLRRSNKPFWPWAIGVAITFILNLGFPHSSHAETGYVQTNLVSDLPGVAIHTDPNLVNPWGIAWGGGSPFSVANNGSGVSTSYDTSGAIQPPVITIPPAAGSKSPGTPTGIVFNSTSNFEITA